MRVKRLCAIILALAFLCGGATAESATPLWRGKLTHATRLRAEKRKDAKMLKAGGAEYDQIWLYALEDGWYLASMDGETMGWVWEDRVYELWALADVPVPGAQCPSGVVTLTEPMTVALGRFKSNVLPAGTVIAAESADLVPCMRGWAALPEGSGRYMAFALMDDAPPGAVLAAFTTWYNDQTGGRLAANRRRNIALAAARVDGTVLLPGETFSFNERCAPYRTRNGYVDAPNITRDGHGVGGGVCQVSTTIYNAVLALPLRVEEWQVHRVMGVSYVPRNLDACVSNRLDFRFTNTLGYAIVLGVVTQNGALTCVIRRAQEGT